MSDTPPEAPAPMQLEFTGDTAAIDEEISMLNDLKENVLRGWLEVGRDAGNRLVFRIAAEGRAKVERMGKP